MAENKLIADLEKRFQAVAGDDGVVDRGEFRKALALREDYYADRLFAMVDDDNSGHIDLDEFIAFAKTALQGDTEAQLRFAFRLHDADDSGEITRDELATIIRASVAQHALELPDRAIDGLTDALFARADTDGDGTIGFDEFCAVLDAYPDLKRQMSLSAATWLKPAPPRRRQKVSFGEVWRRWCRQIANNRAASLCLVMYVVANGVLFLNAMDTYRSQGANLYVQIARGGGACLNFNGMLILIPMLRHLLTWLRQTTVGGLLPIDNSIAFHKLVGHTMLGFAAVHTVAHLLNYATLPESVGHYLFQTDAGLTGGLLSLVFVVMWVCALDFVRRRGHFELFYFNHFLFIPWFILAVMHGPVFWQWASVPIAGYVIERVFRAARTRRALPINALEPLASGVTRLQVQLPESFRYQPGDYVFVRYPTISKHEWHPFTVTTCPEETGQLSLHVRGLGNWTRRLHEHARKQQAEQTGDAKEVAYLDGPYGTPSSQIFKSKVAVLIGAGIGATPFAAILKSLFMRRAKGDAEVGVQKAHFIWMNRDQFSFEWFSEMLGALEVQDPERQFLDIQSYLTGVKLDLTSTSLDVAMDVYQQETGRDLFTGLRNRTNMGRPDWQAVFKALKQEHGETPVDVYFCGPPALSKVLGLLAARHGFGYHKENF